MKQSSKADVPFIPTPEIVNPKPSSPEEIEKWVQRILKGKLSKCKK
tara:strand:+ start:348 stop:485 length:138 start_codon:yes stop_codon:yes gene_type:complete